MALSGQPGIVLRFRGCGPSLSASRASSSPSREPPNSPPRLGPSGLCHIANAVGTYFDAADAKERAIVRFAYRDRFLAAAAALVAGAADVALVAPRLCAFAGRNEPAAPGNSGRRPHWHICTRRAPQRRRAVARWTANGAVTGGDPPLVPFEENQVYAPTPLQAGKQCPSSQYSCTVGLICSQIVTVEMFFASSRIVALGPSVTGIMFLIARNRNIW